MSAFSVSDLLNPAPLSHPASPQHNDTMMEDDPPSTVAGDMFAPELFQTNGLNDAPSIFEQQGMIPLEHSSSPEFMRKDSITTDMLNGMDTMMEDESGSVEPQSTKKKERSTKQRDPTKLKDTKHSSKNEGQHTDKRYLCYICHKLFTRRRSVRDHLNKIHGEKTWEPQKSLEVAVEPHSGEPIEPIEDIVARGPPLPPPKPQKQPKEHKDTKPEKDGLEDEKEEETIIQTQEREEPERRESVADIAPEPVIEEPPPPDSKPELEIRREETEPETLPEPEAVPVKLKKEVSQQSESRPASVEPSLPAPVIGKKRPLPMPKKGTAKFKSSTPSKRLKLSESERSTPARSPSVTPAQRGGSKLKKNVNLEPPSSRASSRQPSPSPTPSVATPASSNDDGEIFCICRKGDNHTWMIACDGPCEEWFHGKCVGIRERDGELIDKYICPTCSKDGFITTWKRMCRRQDCRKPARVKDNPPSKYCSVECGRMFFVELIRRGDPNAQATRDGQFVVDEKSEKKRRKKVRRDRPVQARKPGTDTPMIVGSRPHTPAYSEDERSEYETDSSLDEEQLPNRGGSLRAGEVKALLQQCKNIGSWRELGKKPATPPRELDEKDATKLVYDDFEVARVEEIKKAQAESDEKMSLLDAREKMLELIKARSATIADDIKKSNPKQKEICGYDSRVAWCDEEFLEWFNRDGKQVLDSGKIGPPGEDTIMTNGVHESDDEKAATMKGGVCARNRCAKHGKAGMWQRQQLQELRFEQELVKKRQEVLSSQEHDIRSRAQIRALERQKF
ncbi:COMPASS (complex proteins associated with Set1p) component [Knufia fluminis]|uniref:COMPASS (Complex proteins associated with Set1p) component n=1 Tax=Knufia fluminis TaxID=191047 RepID=A0AAN8EBY6_9EURO|nr:COMPASS (complex proteins associated with Set1p) component [Knufia fluminis]